MISFLAPLLLACPAQEAPRAADFLPADTFLAVEFSLEPWQRLGEQTIVAQIAQQGELAGALAPMVEQTELAMAQASAQIGFDLAALLHGSRMHIAVPFSTVQAQGGSLVFAADLAPSIAQSVELGKTLNAFGQGAWYQEGTILIGVLHTDELDGMDQRLQTGFAEGVFVPSPQREADLSALNKLIEGGRQGTGWTGQPAYRRMAAQVRTGNELMAFWLVVDHIDRAFIEQAGGEELPAGIEELAAQAGLDKLEGIAYSFSVAPPMFEDRLVLSGPGFGAGMFPADMLELVDLPQFLAVLPHDAMQVQLSAMDYGALTSMLRGMVDLAISMSGESIPPEGEAALAGIWQGLEAVGPVSVGMARRADFDRGLPGDIWLQVHDHESLQGALDLLPQEVRDGLATITAMAPNAPKLKLAIEGNRFVLSESLGAPTTERLLTQAEFQSAADWLRQFPSTQVWGIEFIHRDIIVEGFEMLRARGDGFIGSAMDRAPVRFSSLPDRVVMQSILRPMTGVWMADQNGVSSITRSPLGMIPTRLLVAVPSLVNLAENFGMVLGEQLDEDEF